LLKVNWLVSLYTAEFRPVFRRGEGWQLGTVPRTPRCGGDRRNGWIDRSV